MEPQTSRQGFSPSAASKTAFSPADKNKNSYAPSLRLGTSAPRRVGRRLKCCSTRLGRDVAWQAIPAHLLGKKLAFLLQPSPTSSQLGTLERKPRITTTMRCFSTHASYLKSTVCSSFRGGAGRGVGSGQRSFHPRIRHGSKFFGGNVFLWRL